MSAEPRLIPSGSQTVGPYFRIGLEYLVGRKGAAEENTATITLRGRVLDGNQAPVPDAMLEFWTAGVGRAPGKGNATSLPGGFGRVATDVEGSYSMVISRPAPVPFDEQTMQAPHMIVLVFARGLLRHLITRVYFEVEPENNSDPVLRGIAAERRRTLIAQSNGERSFRWDVVLQGNEETVFFAW